MIEINNLSRIKIDKRFFKKVIQRVLRGESASRRKKTEISLAFINPAKIRKLNKKYRKKDKSTDILSYIYNRNSGEIVICPQKVKNNAKIYKSAFKKELSRVLIHGILHLLGHKHKKPSTRINSVRGKKMEEKENYYLNLCLKIKS